MAESTSPTLSRSSHKLEYTPCISTTIRSPAVITTYHSSFDFISEPRDCDTLVNTNQDNEQNHPRILDDDLRRLDMHPTERIIKTKTRKLDRTESISLPTTPTEQISPSFEYKYPLLLALKNEINHEADDDELSASCKSPNDDITIAPEQESINDELMPISKKYYFLFFIFNRTFEYTL
jgi:hypothetical protein